MSHKKRFSDVSLKTFIVAGSGGLSNQILQDLVFFGNLPGC